MIAFSPSSAIGRLLLLRTIAIVVQLTMVLASTYMFSKDIDLFPALTVIALESVFQLVSVYAYRNTHEAAFSGMLLQLLADIVFLTILLSLSGGASNAFVSLLLLPIVIAAVTLPKKYVLLISSLAVASYLYLFFSMPMEHVHHVDMTGHLQGMLVNFVFSVLVIVFVVMALAHKLQQREKSLARVREKQLKNEQMMALGAAGAQVTHQLATPIGTLNMLFEELKEETPQHELWQDFEQALGQCKTHLDGFRAQAEYLRNTTSERSQSIENILKTLNELVVMQYPEQRFDVVEQHAHGDVSADPMLVPALLNIVANSARANEQSNHTDLLITSKIINKTWQFSITDHGAGIEPDKLVMLGHELIPSEHGFGMALLLSHATLERLNGVMTIENHPNLGATTVVRLPLIMKEKSE